MPRVLIAASVAAMGVGVFQVFDAEAMTTGGGLEYVPTKCVAVHPDGSEDDLGPSNDCTDGDSNCQDNDCSRFM
ncbi:hypothetical protein FKX85_08240 [Echinicola soli]|uniref:Uncharacterized protein n=1 Tax=Echinicola soli TaxID=2591634 RepID=A0A514CGS6_9BACT|nr:hypothetical protein [Echinicola soli]QDH79026.1 hypothetical protein FKX85_08240 [Echinicola soli]